MESLLTALADSFRPATHRHPDLEGELDALHDRFATADRARAWTPTDLDLVTRLEALERARRDDDPPVADAMGREMLATTLGEVVPDLEEPVATVGPTAADVLSRLDRPVTGHGADAVVGSEPGALGGIVVTEADHLAPRALVDLVAAAARALRPGGQLVVSAADPTSRGARPGALHPLGLEAVCTAVGFRTFELHDPTPFAGPDPTIDGQIGSEERVARLADLLSGPQHFVAVVRR
jgi:hypothetical protein